MRIYLIGFMASGKSTLGVRVAAALDVPFFDTDQVIEAQAGMTIPEIFLSQGEYYFRNLEADILRQTTFYPKAINSTGGGLPCFEDNMQWMMSHGITMYLQWPDDIITRNALKARNSRPLLSGLIDSEAELTIKDLLLLRKPVYEQASMTIEMQGDEESDYAILEKACRYIW
jgi:shikimate kinase